MKRERQKIFQIVLITIGFILIFVTYFIYPNIEKNQIADNEPVNEDIDNEPSEEKGATYFNNLEYNGLYDLNKAFTIKSEKAYIKKEEDVVFMKKMDMTLTLRDGRIVTIVSNKGRYNRVSHDAFFEEDVITTDGEVKILSQNLDLLATEDIVKIYNDVNLNSSTGYLKADKIDYDFETKYFKISMFDERSVQMKVNK